MKYLTLFLILLFYSNVFAQEVLISPVLNYLCETKNPDSSDYVVIMETIGNEEEKKSFGVLMRTMEVDENPQIDPYYIKLDLYNVIDRGSNSLVTAQNKTLRQITINRGNGDYIHNFIINYDTPDIRTNVVFSGKCKKVDTPTNQ